MPRYRANTNDRALLRALKIAAVAAGGTGIAGSLLVLLLDMGFALGIVVLAALAVGYVTLVAVLAAPRGEEPRLPCTFCGYELFGAAGRVCPECGRASPPEERGPGRKLAGSRRPRRAGREIPK